MRLASALSDAVCKMSEEGKAAQGGSEHLFGFRMHPHFRGVLGRKFYW